MKHRLLSILISAVLVLIARSQELVVRGVVVDKSARTPLEGANIRLSSLADSSKGYSVSSRSNGSFEFKGVAPQTYVLRISFVGYLRLTKTVSVGENGGDLGILELEQGEIPLGEVVVRAQQPPAIQLGDTTEFNARVFKTHPDATAEELVTKMPSVVIENGTVKAQGEEVQQVLVDGKPFFGNDPTLALRNLPADAIEKIQVFDKMSDQAEFTGFDDGQSVKTMNLILRPERRTGEFGKIYAGYGEKGLYTGGGTVNSFQPDRRISILGLSNNVNQQNFSMQDLLGVISSTNRRPGFTGGGGGFAGRGRGGAGFRGGIRGGGGGGGGFGGAPPGMINDPSNFLVGQQNGITSANSAGMNYSGTIGSSLDLTGSYFFNYTNNRNAQSTDRQYFLSKDSLSSYGETSTTGTRNYNHRFNFRGTYTVDPSNSFVINPQLSFQNARSGSVTEGGNYFLENLLSHTATRNDGTSHGYNLSGNVVYRHRFDLPGRTFSIDVGVRPNRKTNASGLVSLLEYGTGPGSVSDSLDQQAGGFSDGLTLSSRVMYTEPISTESIVQFNYTPSYTKSSSDIKTYSPDSLSGAFSSLDPKLSNVFSSKYLTQNAGLGYRVRWGTTNLMIGLDYQRADLQNDKTFPLLSRVDRSFQSILPSAMLMIRFQDRANLRVSYRASTSAPSINQLQDVLDNSNPLLLSKGNPDLRQSYSHILLTRYSNIDPSTGNSLFLFLTANYTSDAVGNATSIAGNDTLVVRGVSLAPGTQLTVPVNLDHAWNVQSLVAYGFPLGFLKSLLNLTSGISYSANPGLVNESLNNAKSTTFTLGAVLASSISEDVDFTLSYAGNYNIASYTLEPELNSHYFYHTAGLKLNLMFWDGVVLRNDVSNVLYRGLSAGYNQNIVLWNIGVAKKFFAQDQGEVRLSVTDLLNQNRNVRRTVTDSYIENSSSVVLGRYLMLTFTYTVK